MEFNIFSKLLLFYILFFSLKSLAANFSIFSSGNTTYISSSSKDDLEYELKFFDMAFAKINQNPWLDYKNTIRGTYSIHHNASTNKYYASLNQFMPGFLKTRWTDTGQEEENEGINCFGTTLFMAGINPTMRYASIDELNSWLHDKTYCQEITEEKDIWPGDILRLEDTHAMIYLSKNFVLSKNGKYKSNRLFFFPLKSVLNQYDIKCNELFEDCKNSIKVFRCNNVWWTLGKRNELSSEVSFIGGSVKATEFEVRKVLDQPEAYHYRNMAKYGNMLMSLENLVKSLQNDDNTNPLIKEWSQKIELAIDSIREQHKNVAEELEISIFGSDRSTHRQ